MTEGRAREEVGNLLADVRRGIWRPPAREPTPEVAVAAEEPTFHEYASEWVERRRFEVDERTAEHWRWALSCHLLPFFAAHLPSQVTGPARGRLQDSEAPRAGGGRAGGRAAGAVGVEHQQDVEGARADPRRRGRGRPPRRDPGAVEAPPAQGGQAAEDVARDGRGRGAGRGGGGASGADRDDGPRRAHGLRDGGAPVAGRRPPARRLRVAESKTDAGVRTVDPVAVARGGARAPPGPGALRRGGRLRLRDEERDAAAAFERHPPDPRARGRGGERPSPQGKAAPRSRG